jgi:hypothetical protein
VDPPALPVRHRQPSSFNLQYSLSRRVPESCRDYVYKSCILLIQVAIIIFTLRAIHVTWAVIGTAKSHHRHQEHYVWGDLSPRKAASDLVNFYPGHTILCNSCEYAQRQCVLATRLRHWYVKWRRRNDSSCRKENNAAQVPYLPRRASRTPSKMLPNIRPRNVIQRAELFRGKEIGLRLDLSLRVPGPR